MIQLRNLQTLLNDKNCKTSNNFDKFLENMNPPILPCIIKSVRGIELAGNLERMKDLSLTTLKINMNSIGPTLYGFAGLQV